MARVAVVLVVAGVLAAAVAGCFAPTREGAAPALAGNLPDLTLGQISNSYQSGHACLVQGTPFGLFVRVINQGSGAAGSFDVNANGYVQTVAGLDAGQNIQLFFAGASSWPNDTNVTVDYTNLVFEANEGNNTFSGPVAAPTQPVTCTPTATPTITPTPTNTPTATPTVDPCLGGPDCDGFDDAAPTKHEGPANTNHAVDNCIGVYNPLQTNSDGDYVKLTPLRPSDDLTQPRSDALGDDCDEDDDNDGLADIVEATADGCIGAAVGVATNPLERDTDFDRVLDGVECGVFGTNPANPGSAPSIADCVSLTGGAGLDTDADGILDYRENCYYGTADFVVDTDGDGCSDGKEVASVNGDREVNVLDLLIVAQTVGAYAIPGTALQRDVDVTKNGTVDVIDLQQVAMANGPCT
jgi:hypothetical protein